MCGGLVVCGDTEAAIGLIDSNGGILFGAHGGLIRRSEHYQKCAASGERFIESMQKAACGLGG